MIVLELCRIHKRVVLTGTDAGDSVRLHSIQAHFYLNIIRQGGPTRDPQSILFCWPSSLEYNIILYLYA